MHAALLAVALAASSGPFLEPGRQIADLVGEHFFDPPRGQAWRRRHRDFGAAAADRDAFALLTNRLLGELKASHTRFYGVEDPGYYGLLSIFERPLKLPPVTTEGVAADFAEIEGRQHVRAVFPGGPADRAGLRRGDRVVSVDGRPFHPHRAFVGKAGSPVVLEVQRRSGGALDRLSVTPRRIAPRQEWMEAQRGWSRVVDGPGGRKVAYARIWSCAGTEYEEQLGEDIREVFQEAGALVVDFRDGWGGCNPTFINLFNRLVPALIGKGPDGKDHRTELTWKRPLFLLINGGSRSGKEVVAALVQKHRIGTLVGERTAGAVLAGRPFPLPDGVLYLAVQEAGLEGLPRLEGVGVAPDVAVADPLAWAEGADPMLEQALELARRAITAPG